MRIAFTIALFSIIVSTNAQFVDDFDLGSSDIKTIQLRFAHRLSGPMPVTVDHGQPNKGYNKTQVIRNNKGEELDFSSIAHALQQFEAMDWRQEDSYVVVEGDASFVCFIMRRGSN